MNLSFSPNSSRTPPYLLLLLLAIVLVIFATKGHAQSFCNVFPIGNPTALNLSKGGFRADTSFQLPRVKALFTCQDSIGRMYYSPTDSIPYFHNGLIWKPLSGGSGSGTVTSFSSGNLSPLFTTNVSTPTTTPHLSFTLSNAASYSFLANFTGSTAAPTYFQPTGTPSSTTFLRGDGSWSSPVGTVFSVTFNNGLTASPNPITGTGTAGLAAIAATSVLANTSGSSGIPSTALGYASNSTPSTLVYRDASSNAYANNFISGTGIIPATGGTSGLTVASPRNIQVTGTGKETLQLGVGTTYTPGSTYEINNNATDTVFVVDNGLNPVYSIPAGGAERIINTDNSTSNGSWDKHGLIPAVDYWGTAELAVTGTVKVSTLTASKVVFTSSTKTLTSTGIGTSSQFIKGDGSLDGTSYGTGSVTSVTANALSPLFTSSTATSTTTPVISFSLSNAAAHTFFGNFTGSSGAPSYSSPTLASADFANQGTTTTLLHGNASGNPSFGQVATGDVAANAITYAKIQTETASTLLGNPTTVNAAPSEITLGSGLSFSGSTLVATGTTYSAGTGITLTSTTFSANLSTGISGGQTEIGGTAAGDQLVIEGSSTANTGNTTTAPVKITGNTLNGSSVAQKGFHVAQTINQTSTAGYTLIQGSATETANGSGENDLLGLYAGSGGTTKKFTIDNTGTITTGLGVTQAANDNSTKLATTAYVDQYVPNYSSATTTATLTPTAAITDRRTPVYANLTAQASTLVIANPSGTFADNQVIQLRFFDNGSSQTLSWDTNYNAGNGTLPTSTTTGKDIYIEFEKNNRSSKYDCVAGCGATAW